ncbi:MAG: retron system putative HNH endonuclease [Betaproteobacteria bacterium]
MRFIPKQGEPAALRDWKRDMKARAPQNLNYSNLPADVKDEVKRELLIEQGHLCAYTMRRLSGLDDCHIEHIEPQSSAPNKDLIFSNMAACFPKNGGDVSAGYGAPIKADRLVTLNVDFVSPHRAGCDRRFQYDAAGAVGAVLGDAVAKQTIDTLQLNHDGLMDLRRIAVQAHGLAVARQATRTSRKLKSATEARRFATEVLQADAQGLLEPFCLALAQVALDYASKEDARSQGLRQSHGSGRT